MSEESGVREIPTSPEETVGGGRSRIVLVGIPADTEINPIVNRWIVGLEELGNKMKLGLVFNPTDANENTPSNNGPWDIGALLTGEGLRDVDVSIVRTSKNPQENFVHQLQLTVVPSDDTRAISLEDEETDGPTWPSRISIKYAQSAIICCPVTEVDSPSIRESVGGLKRANPQIDVFICAYDSTGVRHNPADNFDREFPFLRVTQADVLITLVPLLRVLDGQLMVARQEANKRMGGIKKFLFGSMPRFDPYSPYYID